MPTLLRRPVRGTDRPRQMTTALPRLALIAVAGLGAIPAAGAEPSLSGRYRGRGEGTLTLTVAPPVRDARGEAYRITAGTAIRDRCTGSVSGLARRDGPNALRLTTPNAEPGEAAEETCTLTLMFSPDGRRVRVEETTCSAFHGTECGFSGALTRR